jgi:uncharacterized protein (DUF4415 family)
MASIFGMRNSSPAKVPSWSAATKAQAAAPQFRAIGRLRNDLAMLVFSPLGSEAVAESACTRQARQKGSCMTKHKRKPRSLSEPEEARIQAGIARQYTKVAVSLRLTREVVERFKADGAWLADTHGRRLEEGSGFVVHARSLLPCAMNPATPVTK